MALGNLDTRSDTKGTAATSGPAQCGLNTLKSTQHWETGLSSNIFHALKTPFIAGCGDSHFISSACKAETGGWGFKVSLGYSEL